MSKKNYLIIAVVFALVAFTQFFMLTSVPGLHFDEAWQGLYANRIGRESGFWPFTAMNAYTSPILHYILASFFEMFSADLFVMRAVIGAINMMTFLVTALLVLRYSNLLAFAAFGVAWALLPSSVQTHRFYIELTSLNGLMFSIFLWGMYFYKRNPSLSVVLIIFSTLVGTYSHIAFLAVFMAWILTLCVSNLQYLDHKDTKTILFFVGLGLYPLHIRINHEMHGVFPKLMTLTVFIFLLSPILSLKRFFKPAAKFHKLVVYFGWTLFLPFAFYHLDGNLAYAQVTSYPQKMWLPINFLLITFLLFRFFKKSQKENRQLLSLLFSLLICTMVIVLKPGLRFFTPALILTLILCSISFQELTNKKLKYLLGILFIGWNGFQFFHSYALPFSRLGTRDATFSYLGFKETARDFRPFQKPIEWAEDQECLSKLTWVEDDRFLRQLEFIKLTAPISSQSKCPYKKDELFFSHIPNYSLMDSERTKFNTEPPYPHVELLHHEKSWGDLAIWKRKKK